LGQNIFKIPDSWTYKTAAFFGTAGLAAASGISSIYDMSEFSNDSAFKLLVTGSTSGVGTVANLIAKNLNWQITTVDRNSITKKEYFRSLNLNKSIEANDFIKNSSMNLLKQEYHGAIDTLGGEFLSTSIKKLYNNGVCISAGNIYSQKIEKFNSLPFLLRGVSLVGTGSEIMTELKFKKSISFLNKISNSSEHEKFLTIINAHQISEVLEEWLSAKKPGRIAINFSNGLI
jgi:NADPH:quinone reductase-like Zn-dependent oxidoreductase